eukprot:1621492-Amphidinium_carterae.1
MTCCKVRIQSVLRPFRLVIVAIVWIAVRWGGTAPYPLARSYPLPVPPSDHVESANISPAWAKRTSHADKHTAARAKKRPKLYWT